MAAGILKGIGRRENGLILAHKRAEICYNTVSRQSAGRLVIILKGMAQRKDRKSWRVFWTRHSGFVPASCFPSGIPVASAEHAAGAFSFGRCRMDEERKRRVWR